MKRILKSYLFWTYERGSFHYDVMVTLILAFIFLSPLVLKYRDQPEGRRLEASQALVRTDGANGLIIQLSAQQLKADDDLESALQKVIEPLAGKVVIDRYETTKDSTGRASAYKVWAHR
jgi:hypothetical protein